MPDRILFDISAHGRGHLAQTAAIVAGLRASKPGLQVLARSGLPRSLVEARLGPLADFLPSQTDHGLIMSPGLQVDLTRTRFYYQELHADLARHITKLASQVTALKIDLVVSNAGYVALEAASAARVPSCLVCSLSWDELLLALFPHDDGLSAIIDDIAKGYGRADLCFRLAPRMPMPAVRGVDLTAALGTRGKNVRRALLDYLPSQTASVVLLAFGDWDVARPPALETRSETLFLVPHRWRSAPGHVMGVEDLPFTFRDLLASADLVVSKSGYGIVTELALDGKASLLLERPGWPEEPHLLNWLSRHAPFGLLSELAELTMPRVQDALRSARLSGSMEQALGGGERQIVRALLDHLKG
ncbi:hypothetical protein [Sabulicella rubraurantiaca]|uniref:hypothetical protein n=1 Tax=Sabulicella rubraurantiaca TaxID=2811429 RepID=UPI001A96E0CC|nr:hypothetical protein [Sabulicella rubraurantiaca]